MFSPNNVLTWALGTTSVYKCQVTVVIEYCITANSTKQWFEGKINLS